MRIWISHTITITVVILKTTKLGPKCWFNFGYTLFDGFNRKREQKNQQIIIRNRELEVEKRQVVIESDFANMWMAYQNNIELLIWR